MLSCKEVSHLVSQSQDRRLGVAERIGLKLHLLMCDGCRNFTRQMEFLREAFERFRADLPTSHP